MKICVCKHRWLEEAVDTENSGAVLNCQAIIKFVIGRGVEDEDRKHSWLEDADNFTFQVKKTKQCYNYLPRQDLFFFSLLLFFIDRVYPSVRVLFTCICWKLS